MSRVKRALLVQVLLFSQIAFGASLVCAGDLEMVSISSSGVQGDGASLYPSVSDDGKLISFSSRAKNLTDSENPYVSTFVKSLETGEITQLPFKTNSKQQISGNGRFIVFSYGRRPLLPEDTNLRNSIYLYDLKDKKLDLISADIPGIYKDHQSYYPYIDANGRFVVFESLSIYKGVENWYVYLYDREDGSIRNLSFTDPNGWKPHYPSISADGQTVSYFTAAYGGQGYLQKIVIYNVGSDTKEIIDGGHGRPALSADGRYVAFKSMYPDLVPNDKDSYQDIFVLDRKENKIEIASVTNDGISGNGVSGSGEIAMSNDGRYITFASRAKNLTGEESNQNHVFLFDREKKEIELVSKTIDGGYVNASWPAINSDGSVLAFVAGTDNLVENDKNGRQDIVALVRSQDNIPPVVNMEVSQEIIWPPNKKYVGILVDGFAEDNTELASIEITVTDEYGEMVDMIVPGFGSTISLEAWRYGDDLDGRVYTIKAIAEDAAGNVTVATKEVLVPHDMKK